MAANLASARGLIVGEAVMMGLAPFVGRQPAHDIFYEACKESIEARRPVLDVPCERPLVLGKVPRERLASPCDPMNYFGASRLMADRMVQVANERAPNVGVN